jgi:hypothetical protein
MDMPRGKRTVEGLKPVEEKVEQNGKSLESWIWDAACSIRGAKDAPKFKEFILPLIFTKRLCDVFDDEINRIAQEVGSRVKAFKLVKHDKKLVRFFLPLEPKNPDDTVWSIIRTLSDKIGEQLTTHLRTIADADPLLKGIIDRIDFNATTHGQRDIDDARLSNLIEAISAKRLGLSDVDADIIGRSYEYLIRKFAEGGGQSAGEFYTPGEVGEVMALIMDPQPGMSIYDPTCGSAGLLIKCELALDVKMKAAGKKTYAPLKLYGQEQEPGTWAMANMNMIIHDMEGEIQIGDTFRKPKFRQGNRLQTFDRAVAKSFLQDRGLQKFLLKLGDALIAMTGATTGKVASYRQGSPQYAFLNQRVGRFLPDLAKVDQRFIEFAVQTRDFQKRIFENILAAAQGNISPSKIESIELLLPPLVVYTERRGNARIISCRKATQRERRIYEEGNG